ncbi:MAG: acyltransferase [Candidatus Accumulibacter sp.]|jgi:predicted LPLAT superfamily acyltransferase|nr:acyltransferase [Accumulibacter sp.]
MHWARIEEAGFAGGIRFLFWVYRRGGAALFRVLLRGVMLWFFLGHGSARRASLEYLARLHKASGGATPPPTLRNSFRHFMSFGETIAVKLAASDPDKAWDAPYAAEGIEHLERLIGEKRGALIITAHFGNLELCRRLSRDRHRGIRLLLLVHTRHAERFNRILKSLDPEMGIETIEVGAVGLITAMRLSEHISGGGFVVIAGDRVPLAPGGSTLAASFLGGSAHFPMGPYILAAALACPVFVMFSARHGRGFVVTARLLAERVVVPRGAREAAIRPYLEAYVAALAGECRKHPLQWFNFFPFWQAEDRGQNTAANAAFEIRHQPPEGVKHAHTDH